MHNLLFRRNSGVLVLILGGTCLRYFDVLRRVRIANTILRGDKVVCQLGEVKQKPGRVITISFRNFDA
jgi:hypothetical protein